MTDHPVWYVYDELRTSKLNLYYYSSRLARARKWHTGRELLMAATGSTGVAGFWLLATPTGAVVWKSLTTTTALLAVYHSVVRPGETIRKLETQVTGWGRFQHALAELCRRIHETERYDAEQQRELRVLLKENESLMTEPVELDVDAKLLERCFERVQRELPLDKFFVPTENHP